MRYTLLFFLTIAVAIESFAQIPYGTAKDMAPAFSSTVYVGVAGDAEWDEALKEAMEEFWTLTPFEFVSREDLDIIRKEKTNYILDAMDVTEHGTSSTTGLSIDREYKIFALQRGAPRVHPKNSIYMNVIDFAGYEADYTEMAWRIGPMVKLMNDILMDIRDTNSKVAKKPHKAIKHYSEKFHKPEVLKTKTLLIPDGIVRPEDSPAINLSLTLPMDELRKVSSAKESQIKEKYPYAFSVVDKEAVAQALEERRPDTAVLIPVASSMGSQFMIFDTETYECLYFDYKTRGIAMRPNDYQKIFK